MTISRLMRRVWIPAFASALWLLMALSAFAQAPDATDFGPLATTSAEYKFPAAIDPDVLTLRPTELWAVVYRPEPLDAGPYPVLVFLHGNHATCGYSENPRIDDNVQYTFLGTCPPNYVVTPNHLGYTYVAERLASWGYIVVSINANRGINAAGGSADDLGLNQARGKLLLKHLQRLSEWNRFGGTPESLGVDLLGKLDFSHIGLLGHSRGGEGVRAAYNFFRDAGSPWPARIGPANFEGLFEIGPVDGQTDRLFNGDGTTWNVLLPMCDGDVSNLQGIRPLDRMLLILTDNPARQKSNFTVWGANHNYYNTEWQLSDSSGCTGHDSLWSTTVGSPQQRQTSLAGVMAFFRGNVGAEADPTFNQNFNPQFDLPDVVKSVTRVDRGYTDSPNSSVTLKFEDFDRATGTSSYGFPNDASNITIRHSECVDNPMTSCPNSVPNHNTGDPYGRFGHQQAAAISWTAAGSNTFFQTNWTAAGTGRDISAFQTLDLRVSRRCAGLVGAPPSCDDTNALNPTDSTNFSIRLTLADGSLSGPVQLNSYTNLTGPVGGLFNNGLPNLHPILQTARISLADFADADLTKVRGVRLVFDDTPTGAIYVANIRLSTRTGLAAESFGAPASRASVSAAGSLELASRRNITDGNAITIRGVAAASALGDQPGVEIELTSDTPFPVRNELPILRIGSLAIGLSRYADTADTRTLIFSLTLEQFALANSGDEVWVQYGMEETPVRWSFGPLNKAAINQ